MRVYARLEFEAFLDMSLPIDDESVRHAMERVKREDVIESITWEVLE